MPAYDFAVLSPIDFEILVRDLLQKELQITLESFKSGADQGIDLRYISILGNQLVIQCKHYVESSFTTLLRKCEDEVANVRKLTPARYIFVTSHPLTPARKNKIKKLFKPFIKRPSDIYGRNDLNNLLTRFPEVEKQTFKLWFSSTAVFEEMLRTRINNVSRETLLKIQQDARVYVENGSFREALNILERMNLCLIVGVPGIGKTMLAEMLLLHYYSLQYNIVKIEADISEASEVDYINKRRVFYYDDFLGQTSASDKLNKNEDQKLLDFISAMKRSEVSKLILTTREYILNQARIVYEKLDRTRFDSETCIVDLSKYTRLNRAKILYNHIYFSQLPKGFKKSLLRDEGYLRIIDHPNYNPRIIEYMTDYSRLADVDSGEYATLFLRTLENPQELWRHAFLSQLSQPSRDLLIVLLSLPAEVLLEDLEKAYHSYRQESATSLGTKLTQTDFRYALKEADGSFIATTRGPSNRIIVSFHNPSVRDFLENYLASSREELRLLVKSALCFEQLHWLWEHQDSHSEEHTFRAMIDASLSEEFLDVLGSVFELPSFSFWNYYSPQKDVSYLNISFERRALLLASVITVISNQTVMAIWDDTLNQIVDRLRSKLPDKDQLMQLLEKIDDEKLVRDHRRHRLLLGARGFLIGNLDWLSDYRPLLRFINIFPRILSNEEKSQIVEEFPRLARRNIFDELSENDPDELRSYASEIRDIARQLGTNVAPLLSDIEKRARRLEDDAEEPPDDSSDKEEKPDRDWCSDEEIESIFKGL